MPPAAKNNLRLKGDTVEKQKVQLTITEKTIAWSGVVAAGVSFFTIFLVSLKPISTPFYASSIIGPIMGFFIGIGVINLAGRARRIRALTDLEERVSNLETSKKPNEP